MKLLRLIALALALNGCSLGTDPDSPAGSLKVLFIGSNPTSRNNLPATVAQLAASAGLQECYCVAITYPGFALADHYYAGDAVTALEDESWDFVVMQQGPSTNPDAKNHLIEWTTFFNEMIEENGATPILYSVWPPHELISDLPTVADSYRAAAKVIGARVAAGGGAWQLAWAQDAALQLYDVDDYSPSAMGTYLAAMAVFQRIYGRTPVGIQTTAVVDGMAQPWPASIVQLLQTAAASANAAEDSR